jgi:tripartite-type tricarboxylate transporter receptor subunit TctC
MQEAGVVGYETYSIFGLFAPARTPAATINRIHQDVADIIRRADIKATMATRGFEMEGKPAAEFEQIIQAHTAKWRDVIATANIKE